MEQLIELLKQIQELAGVAIDALEGAGSPEGAEKKPGGEGPPPGGGEGGEPKPPMEGKPDGDGDEGKPPFEKR